MSSVLCPLFNSPYYSYTIDLSRQTYTLTFRYNSRSQGYSMDIFNAEETPLIRNVQLVPNYPLIRQFSLSEIPGEFVLVPIEETTLATSGIPNPRRVDQTHALVYLDPDDL